MTPTQKQQLQIVIESIKETHVSLYNDLFWTEFHKTIHHCYACKGYHAMPCPPLRAALKLEKLLEKENGNDESS